jgi:hypothetical protein
MEAATGPINTGRTVLVHDWQDKFLHLQDSPFVGSGLFAQIYSIFRLQDTVGKFERLEFLPGGNAIS